MNSVPSSAEKEIDALAKMMGADARRIDDMVSRLSEATGEVKVIHHKVDEVRSGMDKLADAISIVVKLDIKHQAVETQITAHQILLNKLDDRVDTLEKDHPKLMETRDWVVKAIVGTVGLVLMALAGLVIAR
jgi:predicted  nucleic acid-binding Zn-ribbon protein